MTAAIEAVGVGKRYGRRWVLTDCSMAIPAGRVVGLVGPNGAGKTTLLHLAVGLLKPNAGVITVFGERPDSGPAALARIGFLAQDSPTYARLSVGQHLKMGQWLNPDWDMRYATERIQHLELNMHQRTGTLSGGQRAQLALTLAVAKRPQVLVLDEPVAALDPLARREFLQTLMEIVAVRDVSVVLSSHLVTDLERVCDHVVLLVGGRITLTGDVDELLASHRRLVGPRRSPTRMPAHLTVIEEGHTDKQTTLVVRADAAILDPAWAVTPLTLEDLVLAHLRQARGIVPASPPAGLAAAR